MSARQGMNQGTAIALDPAYVPSPCIKVCAIDRDTGLCRGCKRSLEEIRAWGSLGPEGKRALLEDLRSR